VVASIDCSKFTKSSLVKAIKATSNRRRTAIQSDTPAALTDEFASNNDKITQWKAFLKRSELEDTADLSKVAQGLRQFLPLLLSTSKNEIFDKSWPAGGPLVLKERDRSCRAEGLSARQSARQTCTPGARLALIWFSASVISLYFKSTSHLFRNTYKARLRTENPCVGGSIPPLPIL
jgi:hypothetical protein